jgi:hypothetical protein
MSYDDYTQEDVASCMERLDFTPAEIEANRQYHGKLYLSEAVLECFDGGFMVGETVCKTTGELIQPKVTRDLDALHDQIIDLFDRAAATFKYNSEPTDRAAMRAFLNYVTIRSEMMRLNMAQIAEDFF